jgi:hypothetical protein
MAKKQTKKVEVQEPYVEETVVAEVPKPEPMSVVKEVSKKDAWEIKDRFYLLKGNSKPLTKLIKGCNIYWFDEDKGYERELKYCSNQRTPFVDEMNGEQRLEHVIFRRGILNVPKNKTVLQRLLALHPDNGRVFYEHKPTVVAANEIEVLEMEIKALTAAQNLDIDMAEAVMRVEIGSEVNKMSSKELKRDLLLYAKRNPRLFLELVTDENVMLRNFGIKATELGIIKLSPDQRTFNWGTNDRKLMTVPFDEHPYSALAAWFKTDEGMEIYSNIEKRLK